MRGRERHAPAQLVLWALLVHAVSAGRHELRLIETLLNPSFNAMERPVESDDKPLKVEFTVSLQKIIDVDEKNQMIHTNLWLNIKWSDYKFKWNPEEYGNITIIRLPVSKVWKPDILMYNSADTNFDGSYPTNVLVYSDGVVEQVPPGMFTSSCPIEIKWFPFDDQRCTLKFGSWTYDGNKIDLLLPGGMTEGSGSIQEFKPNGEWELIGMPAVRNEQVYDCCPDTPFQDITFTIHVRRRKLYYMVNIVTPCLLLSALTLLTFLIPPEAGEKISFGVTILLSLTVFLLLVAEALPETSDAVPLIALYFSSVMIMNALSVVFTVIVLVYHFRTGATYEMPNWVKYVICTWLAWILRLERPGTSLQSLLRHAATASASMASASASRTESPAPRHRRRTSKSNGALLEASLEPDASGGGGGSGDGSGGGGGGGGSGGGTGDDEEACRRSGGSARNATSAPPRTPRPLPRRVDSSGGAAAGAAEHGCVGFGGGAAAAAAGGEAVPEELRAAWHELRAILRELRFITGEMRKTDRDEKISIDWKFASTVVDRLLLWLFTIMTVVATLAILLSAPNVFSSS